MELIQIKTSQHLTSFENEWNKIIEENTKDNPFEQFIVMSKLLTLLDNEEQMEIYVVKEHRRIIAFFPFKVKKTYFGYLVEFLTLKEEKYVDFLVKKVDKKRTIMFVMDELIKRKICVVFYFNGFKGSSNTLNSILHYLVARNLQVPNYQSVIISDDFEHKRKLIFSTRALKAKVYRNFLWTKEWAVTKS